MNTTSSKIVGAVFVSALLALNMSLTNGRVAETLIFYPDAVFAGDWWRILAHPFIHVSWYHLLLDGSAIVTLWAALRGHSVFRRCAIAATAGAGSLLAALTSPDVYSHGLCGLSGVAHGLMGAVAIQLISSSESDHALRRAGWICLAGVFMKCAIEAMTGSVVFSFFHGNHIGIPIASCHAGGLLGGLAISLIFLLRRHTQDEASAAGPVLNWRRFCATIIPAIQHADSATTADSRDLLPQSPHDHDVGGELFVAFRKSVSRTF